MARDLNIFISHSWGSHDELLRLRNLLKLATSFLIYVTQKRYHKISGKYYVLCFPKG